MKQLILHIGYHRTGTTFIQKFVDANRTRLLEQGVLVPEAGWTGVNHSGLALCLPSGRREVGKQINAGRVSETDADLYSVCWRDLYQSLAEELSRSSAQRAIVSSECFLEWIDHSTLRQALELLRADVRVVCFVRRQDFWIASVFSQLVLDPAFNYAGTWNELPQLNMLDFNRELLLWDEVVGSANVRVLPYDEGGEMTATSASLLAEIGIQSATDRREFTLPARRANQSLDRVCIEVLRLANRLAPGDPDLRDSLKQLSAEFRDQQCFEKWTLSSTEAGKLLEQYASSNELLQSRYEVRWQVPTRESHGVNRLSDGQRRAKLLSALERCGAVLGTDATATLAEWLRESL